MWANALTLLMDFQHIKCFSEDGVCALVFPSALEAEDSNPGSGRSGKSSHVLGVLRGDTAPSTSFIVRPTGNSTMKMGYGEDHGALCMVKLYEGTAPSCLWGKQGTATGSVRLRDVVGLQLTLPCKVGLASACSPSSRSTLAGI